MPLWVGFYCPARPTFLLLPSILKRWLVCQFEGTNHPIESCQPFMTRDMRWDKETFCFHRYPISQTRFFFLLYYSCFVFVAVLLLNDQQPSGDVSCRAVEFYIIYPASIIKMRREKEDENGHRELRFVERRREKQHGLRELWRKFPSFLFVCFLLLWFDYETRNKSEVASWLSFIWCMLMNLPSTRRE